MAEIEGTKVTLNVDSAYLKLALRRASRRLQEHYERQAMEEQKDLAQDIFMLMIECYKNASDYQVIPQEFMEDVEDVQQDRYMSMAEESILAAKTFHECWENSHP